MTHNLSQALLGFILLIVLASPTMAGTQQPASTNSLTQEDIAFVFGPGANIADFTPLSPREMAVTDGDFWYFWPNAWRFRFRVIADFARSLIRGRWFQMGNYAYKFGYHKHYHYFPKQQWGRLAGWRRHLQLNRVAFEVKNGKFVPRKEISKDGFKYEVIRGSNKPWRIPWGRKNIEKPIPKRYRKTDTLKLTHSLEDATEDDFVPSDVLINLVASEIQIREEWLRGPRTMREPLYEGPLPSQQLRGMIFNIVLPTQADVCRDYGGRAFGC